MEKKRTQRLTVSGVLIALATILSFIKVFELPFGGSITLCSMLPIMTIGFMYGAKWGLYAGTAYGIIQAVLGATMSSAFAGQKLWGILLICVLDYLVAFAVLGLAGMFKDKIKSVPVAFVLGITVAGILRYITHVVSGFILFGSWAEWFFSQEGFYSWGQTILDNFSGTGLSLIYSIIYNAMYMIPEIILTAIVGGIIIAVPIMRKTMLYAEK